MTETTEKKTTAKAAAPKKHKTLVEALAAFQADMPSVTLDGKNPHFNSKFATLANISNIVTPKLLAQGIVHSNGSRVTDEGKMVITVEIVHVESGEAKTAEFPVTQTDPQKVGSAMSYFRRYGLAALTGIVADGDDDGNSASAPAPKPLQNARAQAPRKGQDNEVEALKKRIREEFIEGKGIDKDAVNELVKTHKGAKLTGVKLFQAVVSDLEKL